MNLANEAMLIATAGGALGGIASFLRLAFDGFKKIPTSAPKLGKAIKVQRFYFVVARTIFGAVCAFIFSFWFMENYENGSLHKAKLAFISVLIGFSTTVLATASEKIYKLLG